MSSLPPVPPIAPADYTTLILQAVHSVVAPAVDAALASSGPVGMAAAGALAGLLPILMNQMSPPSTAEVNAMALALGALDAAIAAMPDPKIA